MKWNRSFNDILQMYCPFLSKLVSVFEQTEPILRNRELKDPIDGSDNGTGNIDEREPSNIDDIKTWDSANEHLFIILILRTTGVAQSVLFQLGPNNDRPGDGKTVWLLLQRKYQNSSQQRRRTFLRRLNNSVMKADVILMYLCLKYINYATNLVIWTK